MFKNIPYLYLTSLASLLSSSILLYIVSIASDQFVVQFYLLTGVGAIISDLLLPSYADAIVSCVHNKENLNLKKLKLSILKFGIACLTFFIFFVLVLMLNLSHILPDLTYFVFFIPFIFFHRIASIYARTYSRLSNKYYIFLIPELFKLVFLLIFLFFVLNDFSFDQTNLYASLGFILYLLPLISWLILSNIFSNKLYQFIIKNNSISTLHKSIEFNLYLFIRDNWYRLITISPIRQAWIPSLTILGSADFLILAKAFSIYGRVGQKLVNVLRPYIYGLINTNENSNILDKKYLFLIWFITIIIMFLIPYILNINIFDDAYLTIMSALPVIILSYISIMWFENPLRVIKSQNISKVLPYQYFSSFQFLVVVSLIYFLNSDFYISAIVLVTSYLFAQLLPAIVMNIMANKLA